MASKDSLPVSVVIPAYNGAPFIADAMRSVYFQTCLPREIIVVDDASTDRTILRVEQEVTRAPVPVRLIRLPRNSGGPAHPMNVGIQAARSPVIAVLDQDDVFLPQKIAGQVAVLTANPDVAFVFGYFDFVRSEPSARGEASGGGLKTVVREGEIPVGLEFNTTWTRQEPYPPGLEMRSGLNVRQRGLVAASERQQRPLLRQMNREGDVLYCDAHRALRVLIRRGNCVGGFPSFLFRREDWYAVGGLDERLVAAADYDFLCRLCRGGRVAMVPDIHYRIRRHADNLSRNSILCYTNEIETLLKFRSCSAGSRMGLEVRRSIGSNLYRLAVLLAEAGSGAVARHLLTQSLLLGGLDPRSVLRAMEYPLKVYRRKRRGRQTAITVTDRKRIACILRKVEAEYRSRGNYSRLKQNRLADRLRPYSLHGDCMTAACGERGSS